jgi:hypothetical protein
MRGIEVRLGSGYRERLEAVIGSGNSPQKHVWRAQSAYSRVADEYERLAETGRGLPCASSPPGAIRPAGKLWRPNGRHPAQTPSATSERIIV